MNIAILGFGVVGSGVYELIKQNRDIIEKSANCEIVVKYIFDKKSLEGELTPLAAKIFKQIVEDEEVDLLVEAMGGTEPAFEYVLQAICSGKNVVTSNKELVAEKGAELIAAAKKHGVSFLFEASVAGGTPVLHPIYRCLAANRPQYAYGILNGTTNFILTKMIKEGMGFDEALNMAQNLGYAEADPTADVEGIDACRKVCVLASLMFGRHVYPRSVHTQGITKITAEDVAYATQAGFAIKLIGQVRLQNDGRIMPIVSPAFVPNSNLLSRVDDVFNAVMVGTDAAGDVLFSGRGAGKMPTASAVLSDIIEIATNNGRVSQFDWTDGDDTFIANYLDYPLKAYVRIEGDIPTEFADVCNLMPLKAGESAFIVSENSERELQKKLEQSGVKVLSCIRLL